MLYAEDSFFTLGTGGRIGLLCLTLTLSAICLALVWWLAKGWGRVMRVVIALIAFYLFLWLSPQIYYLFYLAISDGLPLQWVIQAPPGVTKIARLLTFTDRVTLTEHGQGVLAWAMILTALLRRRAQAE